MAIIYKNGIAYGNQRALDATLTQQGEDADAKAVGDALALKAGTGVIADDFSTSQSYAIGDYTYYNGSLYRFTAAHSAGAWVGTDAQAVQLAEDVVDLKNTLNHKADLIYDTASGDIASFPDGADGLPVKNLTVAIEPVQDLHGYDYPWPAGGGKNKFDIASKIPGYISISGEVVLDNASYHSVLIPVNEGTTYTFSGVSGSANVVTNKRMHGYNANGDWVKQLNYTPVQENTTAPFSVTTTIPTNENIVYIAISFYGEDQNIQVEIGSTATTYAPYSNICPISGWTGANVSRTGKNLLPNITGTRDQDSVFIGQANGSTYPTHLIAGVTYAISFRTNIDGGFVYMKENGGSNIFFGVSGGTYTPTSDMDVQMWVYKSGLTSVSNFQLEIGSTATVYEPYSGTTLPISWETEAGTVYGGTLDVTSGVLTVDREYIDISAITSDWSNYSGINGYTLYLPQLAPETRTIISSHFRTLSLPDAITGIATNTTHYIYFCNAANYGATIADFRQWLSDNNVQFVIDLAEARTYQLTPEEVTTLLGQNNIWADCGPSTVEYPCDTKTYAGNGIGKVENTLTQLDQNMAYVESGNTASRTYTYGQFISWKGTLYTVSDRNGIPMGTTFNIGTNLALVTDVNGALCGGLNVLNVKVGQLTGTTSANGNIEITPLFSTPKKILSAWSSRPDTIVLPFAADGQTPGGGGELGAQKWWFHCMSVLSGHDVVGGTELTIYYAYV